MFNIIFRSPWYAKAFLALILVGLCLIVHHETEKERVENALALAQGMPAAVPLEQFDLKRDIHPADEVHVTGWINPAYNYELVQVTKRKRSSSEQKRRMFVLFGESDGVDSTTARAVVMLDEPEVEGFLAGMTQNVRGFTEAGILFDLNGQRTRSPDLDDLAEDALAEKGLQKAPGFIFIEMWDGGRAAALQPPPMPLENRPLQVLGGAAVFMALVTVVSFLGRGKKPMVAPAVAPVVASPFVQAAAAPQPASGKTPWKLLGGLGVVAVIVLGVAFGGGVVSGLIMLGVFLLGIYQANRMLRRGIAGVWTAATGGGKTQAEGQGAGQVASGPIEQPVGLLDRLGLHTQKKPQGAAAYVPFVVALGVVAVMTMTGGPNGGQLGALFGDLPKAVAPMGAMNEVAVQKAGQPGLAVEPETKPETKPVVEPVVEAVAAPVADPQPFVLPLPLVQIGLAVLGVVALGLLAFWLFGRIRRTADDDDWARLDAMVAREKALERRRIRPA